MMQRSGKRCAVIFTITAIAVVCGVMTIVGAPPAGWTQWGADPQHTGQVNWRGDSLNRIIQTIVYDPFVADQMAATGGNLLVHYQVPIVDGNDVYMEFKSGTFTGRATWETQDWLEKRLSWQNGQ